MRYFLFHVNYSIKGKGCAIADDTIQCEEEIYGITNIYTIV